MSDSFQVRFADFFGDGFSSVGIAGPEKLLARVLHKIEQAHSCSFLSFIELVFR